MGAAYAVGGGTDGFHHPLRRARAGQSAKRFPSMTIVPTIHGELMLGRVGDTLVEVAACWAFVLLITGVYL